MALMRTPEQTRVMVGLSGGVDSAVSAHLLQQAGYQVEALFMKNWEEDDTQTYCSAAQDRQDAEAICQQLQIPFHTVNFSAEYWDSVFTYFLESYKKGWTPNPDVLCNQEIKFKAFLDYALSLGADYIATGHYARKEEGPTLHRSADPNKDQTYFLYRLSKEALGRSLFPLANHHKPQVRAIAQQCRFANAQKKDSTGICFIGEKKFNSFLKHYLPAQPGILKTPEGSIIGTHTGLMYYTLGQRQGLHIGGRSDGSGAPWYVVGKHLQDNLLYVSQDPDHPWHFATQLEAEEAHWISGPPSESFAALARTRHRQPLEPCWIDQISAERFRITFERPQRALTPGQACVLYQDTLCLGGGTISKTNSPGGIHS